jgi:PAS domain S-box-containing protein
MRNTSKSHSLQFLIQELFDENEYPREKLAAIEAAAKLQQDLHQTLSSAISIGYWEWDEITKQAAYFSKEMADIFGVSLESLYEMYHTEEDFFPSIHPDDLKHYIANLSVILNPKHPRGLAHIFEYRIVRPNGEVRHVRELEYGKLEKDGVISRSFGAIQDVTEYANLRKNIEESATKLKLAARTAKLGYWHYDEVALKYLDVSEEYAAIHGYTVPEYLDRFLHFEDDMATVHPEDKEALYEAYELVKGKQDIVFRAQHKDGHWIHVREIATDILDEAGNCIESIGTLQDVTELKNAEQSLRESRDSLEAVVEERTKQLADTIKRLEQEIEERKKISSELENQNAELERFAYTVSHDLKAPLVTIKGFAGLLDKDIDARDMDHVKSDLEQINRAADTMGVLLGDLLELSRIGRVMGNPLICDLNEITKQAVELIGVKVDELGVEIVIEDMPRVHGDEKRLVEVYLNLIENAIKFMGEQISPRIQIGAIEKDGMICCFVQDNGVGIAAEYYEQIFGLFERLNADVEGTGVGLSLVKRIIEVHGGEVWAESKGLGLGSKLSFTLPKP